MVVHLLNYGHLYVVRVNETATTKKGKKKLRPKKKLANWIFSVIQEQTQRPHHTRGHVFKLFYLFLFVNMSTLGS